MTRPSELRLRALCRQLLAPYFADGDITGAARDVSEVVIGSTRRGMLLGGICGLAVGVIVGLFLCLLLT